VPEEDCAAFAVRAIDNAESEILVSAYGLTTGSGIVEALVRAKRRGVDVRLIADKTTPCGRSSGIEPLVAAGVPIWIDDQARIAHEKAMMIDEAVTLMGSLVQLDPRCRSKFRRPNLFPPRPSRRLMPRTGTAAMPSQSGSIGAKTGAGLRRRKRADA
jgi:phosphatidylserine/phosphatidylglycerophosphate/cardiolipin synthase-like enzyme